MTTKTPLVTPFVSIRDFGAVPDDDAPFVQSANSKAFKLAQDAMATPGETLGHPIFVPSGAFYLDADLHVTKGLELFGTGYHGESVLEFAPGKSFIVDEATNANPERAGSDCVVRDLVIRSTEDWRNKKGRKDPPAYTNVPQIDPNTPVSTGTPGLVLRAAATVERVHVEGFTGTGIFIHGDVTAFGTNANQWRLRDVRVEGCGGHGIQTLGTDSGGGSCVGATVFVVGGNAIYERGGGNTYVGCYAEDIQFGRGYEADSPGQVTFVGCYAEAAKPTRLAQGGVVWIGGSPGPVEDTEDAFIVEGFANVHPFEIPNRLNRGVKLMLGYQDAPGANGVFGWKSADEGGPLWLFRWLADLKVWATEMGNSFPSGIKVNYHTATGHVRGPGVPGFPSLLLGGPGIADGRGEAIRVETGQTPPPAGVYQRGDLVFHQPSDYSDPRNQPEYIGWVCVDDSDALNLKWRGFGQIEQP